MIARNDHLKKNMNNTEITQQVCSALCPSIDIGHLSECDVQDYSWLGMVLFVLSELIGLSHSPSSGVLHIIKNKIFG
jgi:xanthine dehydrogenase molybdopterin-binding subunit B